MANTRWPRSWVTEMDNLNWTELDRLNARLSKLQSDREEAAAKNRHGVVWQIEGEIRRIDGQRAQLVTYLTRCLIHHVAA
jgi:hypothetical protein